MCCEEMLRTTILEVSDRVHLKFFTPKMDLKFVSGEAEA